MESHILDAGLALPGAPHKSQFPAEAVSIDVGNMLVACYIPPEQSITQHTCKSRCTALAQVLVNQLFSLPVEKSDVGPLALLTASDISSSSSFVTSIPREKPVPRPKPETRWQKFARDRGIQKHKRSRNVFDEATGEYLPRWGRGSVRKTAEDAEWVIEEKNHPAGSQFNPPSEYEDPFHQASAEKRQRKEDQQKRERRNQAARAKEDAKSAFSSASLSAASGVRLSASMSQARLNRAVKLAQRSTRSMGDFDEHRPDEPTIKKKRTRSAQHASGDEKGATLKVLEKVMKSTKESSAIVSGAVNRLMDEERSSKRRKTRDN